MRLEPNPPGKHSHLTKGSRVLLLFCWLMGRLYFTGLIYSGGEIHAVPDVPGDDDAVESLADGTADSAADFFGGFFRHAWQADVLLTFLAQVLLTPLMHKLIIDHAAACLCKRCRAPPGPGPYLPVKYKFLRGMFMEKYNGWAHYNWSMIL